MSLKENKTWQFLVGCFVIFLVYKCWSLGVFSWFFREETEGFESVSLLPLVLTAVVSAIQMVGLIAIMLCSGLQPLAEKAVDYLRARMPRLDRAAKTIEGKIDAEKLVEALNSLDERIASIEIKVGGDK
jgi:hypothetical protein